MFKRTSFIIAAAVAAIFAAAAPAFAAILPKRAPEDTEAIIYVSGERAAVTKVFKAFQKALFYENLAKDAKKDGVDIEKFIHGEVCFFVSSIIKGQMSASVYNGDHADAVFKYLHKMAEKQVAKAKERAEEEKKRAKEKGCEYNSKHYPIPTLSTDKIDGRQAFVFNGEYDNEAVIMLDKNTLQYSSARKMIRLITEPLKENGSALTKAVDTSAIISIAVKADAIPTKGMDDEPKKLFDDIGIVTLVVVESGGDLEATLTGIYKSADKAEAAKTAIEKQLGKVVMGMKAADKAENKMITDILEAIKISRSDSTVTVSLKYSQDKLAKFIEKWDREQREWRKEMEEREKKWAEERKKREEERKK